MNLAELTPIAAQVVGATQRQLPPDLRIHARAVPVHYEALPAEDVIAEGFPADILGLFAGTPHGREFEESNPAPPQILLYLENLWDFAEQDPAAFREETRITYLHELGHYFGWDEDEITRRGLD